MLRTFVYGLFMGSADVIPGVSGGTVALVLGIYKKLIDSIKSLRPRALFYLFRLDFSAFKSEMKEVNFRFLLSLVAGIATAILAGSNLVGTLLDLYPGPTYSFFSGLIIASAYFIFRGLMEEGFGSALPLFVGLLFGFFLVGVDALGLNHQLWIVFLSGAVAVCAMMLPGVSGAFLLLLLGQYEFMLDALGEAFSSLPVISVFLLGAGFGLVAFSRIISFFMNNYEKGTLGFLVGLMVGSLRKPIGVIVTGEPGDLLASLGFFPSLFILVFSGLFGILVVYLVKNSGGGGEATSEGFGSANGN